MAVYSSIRLLYKHPFESQYLVYGLIGAVFIFFSPLYGQQLTLNINTYRTALAVNEIGDWGDPFTWEIWNGSSWNAATVPPNRENEVFIEQRDEVRLTQNQEVGNLHLYGLDNTDSPVGKKLNLQVYDLDVYGALRCFSKTGDTYFLHNSTSLTEDWIYPETGRLVFKGTTRTVVDRSSWSGNNGQSRFGVIFNPDPGHTLTVNAVFKASSFVIQSGTVYQTVNLNGTPATSSFSFNIQDKVSTSAYGDFIIEPGATLISEGTKTPGEIIMRTTNRPAASFHLKEGGRLILLGQEPIIEAVNIRLEGDVYYSGNSGIQRFISGSMAGVAQPSNYNNLFFEGNAVKNLPDLLELEGNLTRLGGGMVNGSSTALHFIGEGDQEIIQTSLHLKEAHVDKPTGVLFLDGQLTVDANFEMIDGEIDFANHHLSINGNYTYSSGNWHNLSQLSYQNLPIILAPSNSTFPFVDGYLGGERKVILSGSLSSANTDLSLSYTQLPGVNWDANFNDHGNIPILYTLNSHFTLTLGDFTSTDKLEILISADNLIVVDDRHLRIVGNNAAAPPTHVDGLNNMARREVQLSELNDQILTLGSTGIASILPLAWLSYHAKQLSMGTLVSWSTSQEWDNREFIIHKSIDTKEFAEIGRLPGQGNSNQIQHYEFLDKGMNVTNRIYYQIKQVDLGGSYAFSPVFHLTLAGSEHSVLAFPNPYLNQKGPMTIRIPEELVGTAARMSVRHISGVTVAQEAGVLEVVAQRVAEHLEGLSAGIYLIVIESSLKPQVIKWLKEN